MLPLWSKEERSHSWEKWLLKDGFLLFLLFSCSSAPTAGWFYCAAAVITTSAENSRNYPIYLSGQGNEENKAPRLGEWEEPQKESWRGAWPNFQYEPVHVSSAAVRYGGFYTHLKATNRAVRRNTWGATEDLNNTINYLDLVYWLLHSKTKGYIFFPPSAHGTLTKIIIRRAM